MHFDRLRIFLEVVESGSFSACARRLGISQPAVSLSVKALEQELGAQLLERSGTGVRPTAIGQQVYRGAWDILRRWDDVQEEVERAVKEPEGPLVLGASTVPGEYILPPMLKGLRDRYPRIELTLRIHGSWTVVEWVREGRVDLAVVGVRPDQGVATFPIAQDELWLVGSPRLAESLGRSDAKDAPLTVEELASLPFIMRENASGTRRVCRDCLRRHGLGESDLAVVATMDSTEAVLASVEADLGVAFISRWAAERAEQAGRLVRLPFCCDHLQRTFYGVYMPERLDRRVVRATAEYLQEQAAGLLPSISPAGNSEPRSG